MEAKGLGGTYKNKMDMYVQVFDYHCVSAHICQQREPAASERDKTLRCPEEWTGGEKKILKCFKYHPCFTMQEGFSI